MQCPNPIRIVTNNIPYYVPCGKCYACINRKINDIRVRALNEYALYNYYAYYVTLTYNQENCPTDRKLKIEHIQKYVKRLRINIERSENIKIQLSYILTGEYGELRGRPHYHAIIMTKQKTIKPLEYYINKSWGNGFTDIYTIFNQPKAISYVIKYIMKMAIYKIEGYEKNVNDIFYTTSKGFGRMTENQKKLLIKKINKSVLNKTNDSKIMTININGRSYAVPIYWKKQLPDHHKKLYSAISQRYIQQSTEENNNIILQYNQLKKKLLKQIQK